VATCKKRSFTLISGNDKENSYSGDNVANQSSSSSSTTTTTVEAKKLFYEENDKSQQDVDVFVNSYLNTSLQERSVTEENLNRFTKGNWYGKKKPYGMQEVRCIQTVIDKVIIEKACSDNLVEGGNALKDIAGSSYWVAIADELTQSSNCSGIRRFILDCHVSNTSLSDKFDDYVTKKWRTMTDETGKTKYHMHLNKALFNTYIFQLSLRKTGISNLVRKKLKKTQSWLQGWTQL
jgi:hypothetical protein